MAAPRKKWRTKLGPLPSMWRSHPSQVAAYRHIQRVAEEFHAGMLRGDLRHVIVQVDEGSGWEPFERVEFADLPTTASP